MFNLYVEWQVRSTGTGYPGPQAVNIYTRLPDLTAFVPNHSGVIHPDDG
jgi:hypothetical protein